MGLEADYATTEMAFLAEKNVRGQGDENLYVRFKMKGKPQPTESRKQGRPIYKDVIYIEIMQPGNKDSIIERPASEDDKRRFPTQFAAFENKEDQDGADGTPLSLWPAITPAQIEEFKYFGVTTVEHLANMSDANGQGFMGFQKLKQDAQAFLARSKDSAEANKLSDELSKRDSEIEMLKGVNSELQERIAKMEAQLGALGDK